MTSVRLPKLPTGKDFEEYLSAFLQSAGYYIERNLIDRQLEEVLELDIIATDYKQKALPSIELLEVKGGHWGFPEIFKIRGWLDYLNLSSGYFLVRQPKTAADFYRKIAGALNIKIIGIPDLAKTKESLAELFSVSSVTDEDIVIWRFAYWTERELLKRLTAKKKSIKDKKAYQALDEYFSLLNNRTFFTQNVVQRASKLYSTYQEFPNITAKLAHELVGDDFDKEYGDLPPSIYKKTYYGQELTDLAISTFIEHRARLAILKSAVDYKLYKDAGNDQNVTQRLKLAGFDFEYSLLDLLPLSFKKGLDEIATHPYLHRYPVFWQWFMWVFGGFILTDYEASEYQLLSQKTGIPVEQIPNALKSYEILFPRDKGWLVSIGAESRIRLMAMFSVPFMGIGANYRRIMYAEGKYGKLKVGGMHTLNDLIRWNKTLVKLLE